MDKKVHSKSELETPKRRSRIGKIRLFINGKKYMIHPIYNLYAGNKYGEVIHISKFTPIKGRIHRTGYLLVTVRGSGDRKQTTVYAHRFIYECYHGIIPKGLVIDHINDNKKDNRLCNLQLMTYHQNNKKEAGNHDPSFFANRKNGKRVKAINLETNDISYYNSLYAAGKRMGVDRSIINRCCQGIHKSSTSKIDGCKYTFEFA